MRKFRKCEQLILCYTPTFFLATRQKKRLIKIKTKTNGAADIKTCNHHISPKHF